MKWFHGVPSPLLARWNEPEFSNPGGGGGELATREGIEGMEGMVGINGKVGKGGNLGRVGKLGNGNVIGCPA